MAFRLTKSQVEKRNALAGQLREKREQLDAVLGTINEEMAKLVANDLQPIIESYNELLGEAREFVEGIAGDSRGEFDDKSETWQDGERGQAVNEFIESWENAALEDVEVPEVSEVEVEFGGDDAEELEGLPEEAN